MNASEKEFNFKGKLTEDFRYVEIHNWRIYRKIFQSALADTELEVIIKPYRRNRSSAQNRYIHGVVVPCVRQWFKHTTGHKYTHDEIYLWLKQAFNDEQPVVKTIMGEEIIVMKSKRPSQMSTKEFSEFTERILAGMTEKGCIIPEPNQDNFFHDFVTK